VPSRNPIRLLPQQRKKISDVFRSEEGWLEIEDEGVIREVDLDKAHCILRHRISGPSDLKCVFSLDQLDQIKDGLDKRVRVVGRLKSGTTAPLHIRMVEILASQ
jgi:hypothetical protein